MNHPEFLKKMLELDAKRRTGVKTDADYANFSLKVYHADELLRAYRELMGVTQGLLGALEYIKKDNGHHVLAATQATEMASALGLKGGV